jgi:hypothetical protein
MADDSDDVGPIEVPDAPPPPSTPLDPEVLAQAEAAKNEANANFKGERSRPPPLRPRSHFTFLCLHKYAGYLFCALWGDTRRVERAIA